ncbi:MAG: hypothetical protein ABW116_01560 [Candidatus Sedimenticola sp. 20ELBAFRAG]
MSKFILQVSYDSALWTEWRQGEGPRYHSHKIIDSCIEVGFGGSGLSITADVDLDETEKLALAKCLVKDTVGFVPHWQTLTPDTHRTVQRVEDLLLSTARQVDHSFRLHEKGVRLPPPKISRVTPPNSHQLFPVFRWQLTDDELKLLSLCDPVSPDVTSRIKKSGLYVPCSPPFGQKQIHMKDEEVAEVFRNLDSSDEVPPYRLLYAISLETFTENRSFGSSVILLATAIETALKWCLRKKGDEVARYLLDNLQSPPLRSLFECVCEQYALQLPEKFGGWLNQLNRARNIVAHNPRDLEVEYLQVARWFATGEAILTSIAGKNVDEHVGMVVEPVGPRASTQFAQGAKGIILRTECSPHDSEMKYHVLMDTGETYYYSEGSFEVLSDRAQKFPDPT